MSSSAMAFPGALIRLADLIDRLTTAVGRAVAWLALVIVLLQFALVLARYVFGFGSIWLTETVIYANAALFLLASAWTLRIGGHVRVDVFYAHVSARAKALIDLIGALLLLLPFAAVLIWLSVPYAARSWAILERSQEASGLPLVFLLKTLHPAVRRADGAAGPGAGDPRGGDAGERKMSALLFTSPLWGEVGSRSEPGEGGLPYREVTCPLTPTLSPKGRGSAPAFVATISPCRSLKPSPSSSSPPSSPR